MNSITGALQGGATNLALKAIQGYRTQLSPRKGWHCAYGTMTGQGTCSGIIADQVRTAGLARSVVPAARQFASCAAQARLAKEARVSGVCCCGPIPIPFKF